MAGLRPSEGPPSLEQAYGPVLLPLAALLAAARQVLAPRPVPERVAS